MGNIWGVMKAFHILICSNSLSDTYICQNSTILLLICSSLFINYSSIKLILKIKGFQKACNGMAYGELIFYWQIIYYKIEKKYCWISEKNSLVLKKINIAQILEGHIIKYTLFLHCFLSLRILPPASSLPYCHYRLSWTDGYFSPSSLLSLYSSLLPMLEKDLLF